MVFDKYTVFLNIAAASLLLSSLVQIATYKIKLRNKWPIRIGFEHANLQVNVYKKFHDIYYIILDGCANPSTLKEIYQYNNDEFTNKLRDKGFFFAENTRSNFAMTIHSLASSLNMEYIDTHIYDFDANNFGVGMARWMIENNYSMRYIKLFGYKVIFLGSGFGVTQTNKNADLEIKCGVIDETLGRLIQSSLFEALASKIHLIEKDKRNRILRMFSRLAQVSRLKGPKFVFAHIPSPQWPFLFDSNGNPTYRQKLDVRQKKEAYVSQLKFIEKKIIELIDVLLSTSEADPIIILQSDHGPNFAFANGYELQNPPLDILLEKMRILNAYHLPGGERDHIYESLTPVNTFRLIFNRYLGTSYQLLNDVSYYSTLEHPYKFSDVTSLMMSN
jgi:hypothetical protein